MHFGTIDVIKVFIIDLSVALLFFQLLLGSHLISALSSHRKSADLQDYFWLLERN
jgi:hypothetical protein